jgi:hypothetical protein
VRRVSAARAGRGEPHRPARTSTRASNLRARSARPHLVDRETGELIAVEPFVAVLGASNLTYADATRTQRVADWTASHVRALECFGGVPAAMVPDQLKSAVIEACRYEPGIHRTYEELAAHYGTTIIPARPAMPRDKAQASFTLRLLPHVRCKFLVPASIAESLAGVRRGGGSVSGAKRISPLSFARTARSTPSIAKRLAVQ